MASSESAMLRGAWKNAAATHRLPHRVAPQQSQLRRLLGTPSTRGGSVASCLPLARFFQLPDLAFNQVAFESTYVRDK